MGTDHRLWLPSGDCTHLVDDFCRHANLYCSAEHLAAATADVPGRAVTVADAATIGRSMWQEASRALEGRTAQPRRIRIWGTAARVVVGGALLSSVAVGHYTGPFRPAAWMLGLVALPAMVAAWGWRRSRRRRPPVRATGPFGHVANMALFFALYATNWYAPSVAVVSDAALIFYGASMLLAAARGYAGCEVLAVSNALHRRDDQVGCAIFAPIDALEAQRP